MCRYFRRDKIASQRQCSTMLHLVVWAVRAATEQGEVEMDWEEAVKVAEEEMAPARWRRK